MSESTEFVARASQPRTTGVESLICLDGAIYMNTADSRVKYRGRTPMAVLFLPWTWPGRLVFLGFIMFLTSGFASYPFRQFVILAGCAVLIGAAAAHFRHARKNQRFWVRVWEVLWSLFLGGGVVFRGLVMFLGAFSFCTWALAALVTNGNQGSMDAFIGNFTINQFSLSFSWPSSGFWSGSRRGCPKLTLACRVFCWA